MEIEKLNFQELRKGIPFDLFPAPVLIILLIFTSQGSSISELRGEQSGEYSRGEYIVTGDVIVPEGETMTIQAGSVIRFKQYTGLIVKGKLECVGNADTLTLLTSYQIQSTPDKISNDVNFSQWNGIEIISGGSVHAEYVRIDNSVFGIKSEKKYKSILLEKVVFSNNVQNFSISDEIIPVENDVEIIFPVVQSNEFTITPPKLLKDTIVIKEVKEIKLLQEPSIKPAVDLENRKRKRWKPPVLFGFGTCAIAGGILGIISYDKAKEKEREYDKSSDVRRTTKKREDAEFFYSLSYILAGISAVGTLGFSISVFF